MKRLFVVDYRKNGDEKHQCIEVNAEGPMTDAALITLCHVHIGLDNALDGVIEVLADMSVNELEEIVLKPEALFLPVRSLFINAEEAKRYLERSTYVKK